MHTLVMVHLGWLDLSLAGKAPKSSLYVSTISYTDMYRSWRDLPCEGGPLAHTHTDGRRLARPAHKHRGRVDRRWPRGDMTGYCLPAV